MGFRVRPATTLTVILGIALAFQVIALISVPITQTITLCTYDGVKFGVFGLCADGSCTSPRIGYSDKDIANLSGFSLPSNARHSVSKLLVVHPIAAGFTFVLFCGAILLHWHGPSTSMKLLFFLLLWCMPAFLLSLLSFLVDILLFVPHLDWAGWIILASTVLIAISAIMFCIMRRTVSSRKAMKKYGNYGENDYQMAPLNYGYGTVDAGSDLKTSTNSNKGDQNSDEGAPFVDNADNTFNFEHSYRYDDIGDIPQTQAYDSVRGSNNASAQSNPSYRNSDILAAPPTSYRGYEYTPANASPRPQNSAPPIPVISDEIPAYDHVPPQAFAPVERDQAVSTSATRNASLPTPPPQTAPYPSEIPIAHLNNIPEVSTVTPKTPYPQDNGILPRQTKLTGPRPMPATPGSGSAQSDTIPPYPPVPADEEWAFVPDEPPAVANDNIQDQGDNDDNDEPSAPPMVTEQKEVRGSKDSLVSSILSNPQLEREGTYRTRIAQKLAELQPQVYSTDSFAETDDELLMAPTAKNQREIGEITDDDEDDNDDTTFDNTMDNTTTEISDDNRESDELYHPVPSPLKLHETDAGAAIPDDASSAYSSRIPSTINTPVHEHFRREPSLIQRSQIPEHEALSSSILESIGTQGISSPSDVTLDSYPFPDAQERRQTPAPSFSNESIGSSTFTSVSQRGINPRYFEKNPEEYASYVQRQNLMQRIQGQPAVNRQTSGTPNNTPVDVLIASNPDFSIGTIGKSTKSKKKNIKGSLMR
ncbi:pH-response regulator protein palI/RIM9 [Cyberlindnera fabianii]|uniref:pH-response regulator protein palI/RIM9 n=1 Tax=Cyberlindnera fabianii TaxID=36022 RepID=A0A1V2L378_CYBFA|nr:pH-response regulator protein palI/RIM9 [Cyberlindnera fabianii]